MVDCHNVGDEREGIGDLGDHHRTQGVGVRLDALVFRCLGDHVLVYHMDDDVYEPDGQSLANQPWNDATRETQKRTKCLRKRFQFLLAEKITY